MKERAEEERREKHRRLREKKDAFKQLLDEAKLHGKYVHWFIVIAFNWCLNCEKFQNDESETLKTLTSSI